MVKTLTIELPEAPADAYLRLVAWWCDFRIAATKTPVFRDVAEARGIEVSTSDAELLFLGLVASVCAACADGGGEWTFLGDANPHPPVAHLARRWRYGGSEPGSDSGDRGGRAGSVLPTRTPRRSASPSTAG
jgi:hypothetical protein